MQATRFYIWEADIDGTPVNVTQPNKPMTLAGALSRARAYLWQNMPRVDSVAIYDDKKFVAAYRLSNVGTALRLSDEGELPCQLVAFINALPR